MNKVRYHLLSFLLLLLATLIAQEEIVISQYIHNQYAINPAFGGSRNCFTVYGAYKQQWTGVEEAPTQQIVALHSPLKNNHFALGLKLNSSKIAIFDQTRATASVSYRLNVTEGSLLAFGLDGGVYMGSSNYQEVTTISEGDPLLANNETTSGLALGGGLGWYGRNFYTSLSVPSFYYYNPDNSGEGELDLGKVNYLISGGYMFQLADKFHLQPSALAILNPTKSVVVDGGVTAIYNSFIWTTLAYRSVGEVVAMFAIQPISSLKIGYSFDYPIGDLATFGSGSHEISLQYDFGHKIKSSNPKFF